MSPKAVKLLHSLQEHYLHLREAIAPPGWTYHSKRDFEDTSGYPEQMSVDALRQRTTAYQPLIEFQILDEYREEFDRCVHERFANQHRYGLDGEVFYGTLETLELNARIVRVPDSAESLILINSALWDCLKLVSRVLAESTGTRTSEEMGAPGKKPFCFDPEGVAHLPVFSRAIQAILERQPLSSAHWPSVPEDRPFACEMGVILDDSLHAFVFAHEYAHALHGHLKPTAGRSPDDRTGRAIGDQIVTSWANEFHADRTALDLCFFRQMIRQSEKASQDGRDGAWATLTTAQGAMVCLALLDHIERMQLVVATPESSHPPTLLRMQRLRRALYDQLGPEGDAYIFGNFVHPLLACLNFCFSSIPASSHRAKDSSPEVERALQDIVFSSLINFRSSQVVIVLRCLVNWYRDRVLVHPGSPDLDDLCSHFAEHVGRLLGNSDDGPQKAVQILESCTAIIEQYVAANMNRDSDEPQ
jgi:hypothetical protein